MGLSYKVISVYITLTYTFRSKQVNYTIPIVNDSTPQDILVHESKNLIFSEKAKKMVKVAQNKKKKAVETI